MDHFEDDDKAQTFDEIKCLEKFHSTFRQKESGNIELAVCWRPNEPDLPNNCEVVEAEFLREESRLLKKNPVSGDKDFLDEQM